MRNERRCHLRPCLTSARLIDVSRRCARRLSHAVLASTFIAASAVSLPAQPGDFRSLLERGFALHEKADYANALPLLERACRLLPHDYFANLLVGIELLRTGRPHDSLAFLREASRQRQDEDFPYDYMGEAQTRLGHYSEAAAAYERALAAAPSSPQAVEGAVGFWVERFRTLAGRLRSTTPGLAAEHRLQARAHSATDPERQALLAQSASLDPAAPGIWSELALANLAAGNRVDASANIARAQAANPSDLGALEATAILAAQGGDWAAAVHALDAIADASPTMMARVAEEWPADLTPPSATSMSSAVTPMFRCRQKQDACVATRPAAGLRASERAQSVAVLFREQRWDRIAALPEPPATAADAWLYRGVALASLGRCATAAPALEKAVQSRSAQQTYGDFVLSWCYAQDADRVARQLPQGEGATAALTHMVRGDVLLRMRADSAAAAAEYSAALQAHPEDPELLERLAEAQYEHGDSAEAIRNAQESLKIDPSRSSAMLTLARVAVQQRRYADAIPYLRTLVARDPRDTAAQVELGTALVQTGNAAEGVEHLLPALDAGYPDEKGSLHSVLGGALRKLGRSQQAAKAFAQARENSDAFQRSGHRGGNDAP